MRHPEIHDLFTQRFVWQKKVNGSSQRRPPEPASVFAESIGNHWQCFQAYCQAKFPES